MTTLSFETKQSCQWKPKQSNLPSKLFRSKLVNTK